MSAGSVVTYDFVQEVFSDTQLSSDIRIESVVILGYDFRDVSELRSHNGLDMKKDTAGIPDGVKSATERITIYIINHSTENIVIDELRFTGDVYEFSGNSNYLSSYVSNDFPGAGEYVILTTTPDVIVQSDLPILYNGKLASFVLGLDDSIKISRHAMLKLTTTNGFVVVKNMIIGSYYDLNGVKCEAKDQESGEGETSETCTNSGGGDNSGSGSSNSGSGDNSGSDTSASDSSGDSSGSANGHGSTGSDSGLGSSGSGSSGGSQPGVGSGSSGPAPSSTN